MIAANFFVVLGNYHFNFISKIKFHPSIILIWLKLNCQFCKKRTYYVYILIQINKWLEMQLLKIEFWNSIINFWLFLDIVKFMKFVGLGQLGQGGVSMGGFGQSISQLNQSVGSTLNSTLPISTAGSSTVYQTHYGLNSLGNMQIKHVQLSRGAQKRFLVWRRRWGTVFILNVWFFKGAYLKSFLNYISWHLWSIYY